MDSVASLSKKLVAPIIVFSCTVLPTSGCGNSTEQEVSNAIADPPVSSPENVGDSTEGLGESGRVREPQELTRNNEAAGAIAHVEPESTELKPTQAEASESTRSPETPELTELAITATQPVATEPDLSETETPDGIQERAEPESTPTVAETLDSAPSEPEPKEQENTTSTADTSETPPTTRPRREIAHREAAVTEEELKEWSRPVFDPMQLLAFPAALRSDFVTQMAHSPDGKQYILAGNRISLWSIGREAPDHVFVENLNAEKEQTIKSLAISPNGKWFVAGDAKGLLRLWSIAGRKLVLSKEIYPTGIAEIAISPDGQEIATLTYSNVVSIWSVPQIKLKKRLQVDSNNLSRLVYVTDRQLAVAGETTTLWDTDTGDKLQQLSPGRYRYAMARSADGKQFAFGDGDRLQLWDIAGEQRAGVLAGKFSNEVLVAFSPDGVNLVTTGGSSIRVWDVATGELVQIMDGYGEPIVGLSWLTGADTVLVASSNGHVKLWGTSSAGERLGLRQVHAPTKLPAADSREPATPAQTLRAMDLRTFPMMPGGQSTIVDSHSLAYNVSVPIEKAETFHRYHLVKQNWTEIPSQPPTPGILKFKKHGFALSVACYGDGNGNTTISLSHAGNYDLRLTPALDDDSVQSVFENEDVIILRTKADLLHLETTLLRKMHAAGWTAYSRLDASHHEREDSRRLSFLRNAVEVNVSIDPFPAEPGMFTVQYSRSLQLNALPIPSDSGFVEFDGSTQPQLVGNTDLGLQQTREFYDQQLVAQGWLPRQNARVLTDEANWLPYVRGQRDLTIGLKRLPTGRTQIQVGKNVRNSSWQLSQPEQRAPAPSDAVGIEAADFPRLDRSQPAKYDVDQKTLELAVDAQLLEVASAYTEQLRSRGWKQEGSGIKDEEYVFLTFAKEGREVEIRARLFEGKAMVQVSGSGILWGKPLPVEQKAISYETWLRRNHHPAGLGMLDTFIAQMKSISASE